MKQKNKILFILFFLAFFGAEKSFAFPLPSWDPFAGAQHILSYKAEIESKTNEIKSTTDLAKKSVLEGMPGYMKLVKSGDWKGLAKKIGEDGYDIYKADREMKNKAKEKAEKEAEKKAKEKLQDQQEAAVESEQAVDENREVASENKKKKSKKLFSWVKKSADSAATWGKKAAGDAGDWLNEGDNKQGVGKIAHGLFGDSGMGSNVNKGIDYLSGEGKKKGGN